MCAHSEYLFGYTTSELAKLRLSEEVKVGFTKSILEKKKPPWAEITLNDEDVEAKE